MEKIMTLHPDGKAGVNIDKRKYEQLRKAILTNLRNKKEMTYRELNRIINTDLKGKFEGKIPWYVITVKLDLEARGEIERIPGTSPQQLRIKRSRA